MKGNPKVIIMKLGIRSDQIGYGKPVGGYLPASTDLPALFYRECGSL